MATVDFSQHLIAGITVLHVTTGQRNSSLFKYSLAWRGFDRALPQASQPQAPGPAGSWRGWASWPAAPGRTHVAHLTRVFSGRPLASAQEQQPGRQHRACGPFQTEITNKKHEISETTKGRLLTVWAETSRQHPPVQPHLAARVAAAQHVTAPGVSTRRRRCATHADLERQVRVCGQICQHGPRLKTDHCASFPDYSTGVYLTQGRFSNLF